MHNFCGFQEVIYQWSLAVELKDRSIEFLREQEMPLFYKNHVPRTRGNKPLLSEYTTPKARFVITAILRVTFRLLKPARGLPCCVRF